MFKKETMDDYSTDCSQTNSPFDTLVHSAQNIKLILCCWH